MGPENVFTPAAPEQHGTVYQRGCAQGPIKGGRGVFPIQVIVLGEEGLTANREGTLFECFDRRSNGFIGTRGDMRCDQSAGRELRATDEETTPGMGMMRGVSTPA